MINAARTICDNPYDEENHRPRSLPCGHGFCTICLETTISRGSSLCPVCRKNHGAKLAKKLPINFDLEKILQNYRSSNFCPKHKTIPIYFHCQTHNVKICHSCIVLDHPSTVCKLSSLEDEVKSIIENGNKTLQNTRKLLQEYIKLRNTEIEKHSEEIYTIKSQINELSTKIGLIQKERAAKSKLVEEAESAIIVNRNKLETLKSVEEKASSSPNIMKTLEKSKSELTQIKDWEENVTKKLNLNNKIEFIVDSSKVSDSIGSSNWQPHKVETELYKLFKSASNEDIFSWIEANIGSDSMSNGKAKFIRALVTALVENQATLSIRVGDDFEERMMTHLPVVLKYVDSNDKLELQCIYALQALSVKYQHPPGLLEKCFNAFYDSEVVGEEAFNEWAKSNDPEEQEGKGVCINSVKNFMRWLQEADVED
ncbi:unnamed protein product [Meganyctiphanes norvegica]|uniref:Uncharacterized protein n=1 Tax=Meganyctiphanes norvegica TaxID=48144 RepID=A0AAV2RLN5_MEGNR